MSDEGTKAHCNRCMGQTNHTILQKEESSWSEDIDDGQYSVDGGDTYEMLKCRGCDGVTFRHRHWFSEEVDENGQSVIHETYYPPAISRRKPDWFGELILETNIDSPLFGLMEEVYTALYADSRMLASMGIRAALDLIMVEKIGDLRTFKEKLQAFKAADYISGKQLAFLEKTIDVGNASAHRGHVPSPADIITLLDIIENLIETIYIHEARIKKISAAPKRKK